MQRSGLSKRQLERNEVSLRQVLAVIVAKFHGGMVVVEGKDMVETIKKIKSVDINTIGGIVSVIVKTKEVQDAVTNREKEAIG